MRRPILRYHGGKWILAPWIISNFPKHRIYCEPFGGAASVLLRKERAYAEIYNDLDSEIVNVFKQARDNGEKLKEQLVFTPFARDEFNEAFEETDDQLERARRTIIRSFMGFGSDGITSKYKTGFRSNSNRSGSTPAHDWKNYGPAFEMLIDRMQGIVIENRDAIDVMMAHDSVDTLHYVDPPYVLDTRKGKGKHGYRHEMDDQQHIELAQQLKSLKGKVCLSGYHHPLYDELYDGWTVIERAARADGAGKRTEVLWLSYTPNQRDLF